MSEHDFMWNMSNYLNNTSNSTNMFGNKTQYQSGSSSSDYDHYRLVLMVIGVFSAVFTPITNISLGLIILFNRQFRQPFYWYMFCLCLSDLLVGVFVMPFSVSYTRESSWKHGVEFCKIWSVLELTHFSLSASILIALCIDRFVAKISSLKPVNFYGKKLIPIALFLFPWIYVLFICLPVLIVGERDLSHLMKREICVFILEQEFFVPTFSVIYMFPVVVLIIVSVIMIVIYSVKKTEWYRLEEGDRNNADRQFLRSSTVATLVVSIATLLFWLPFVIILLMMITCRRGNCFPSLWAYIGTYIVSMLSSPVTPLFWLVHTDVRQAYKRVVASVFSKFGLCQQWRASFDAWDSHHTELLEDNA